MKVVVLNGSPKGKNSITLQTVNYIHKYNTEDEFDVINVGQQISYIEKNLQQSLDKIKAADFILFSYPVYTFIAPAQLHRFVELLKENFTDELNGKFCSQITTSKHFYDTTAQAFIKENCLDLHMTYLEGLYADMEDLTKKRGRQEALDYWRYVKEQIQLSASVASLEETAEKSRKYKVSLVCDIGPENTSLRNRVEAFKKYFPYEIEEYNLQNLRIDGGCISCFKCSTKGECVYKDGFPELLRTKIIPSNAVIYAFTISNHSMGSRFKYYDDRNFCNGHRTMTMDKPVGYIVNGDLSKESNLEQIIYARASVGHNVLTHIATEESSSEDNQIKMLCSKMTYCLENPVVQPQNFYGVGGMKIFRDLIYVMGGMMKADYKFYKAQGFFKDFPTKQGKTRFLMKLVGAMMSNEKLMKKAGNKVTEGMLMPYTKVLEKE